jgi:CheY-like chemotaxis protein
MSAISPDAECVLVVEDEADARAMMCELVELAGCGWSEAANGAEALRVLASRRPCLIVVDLLMPIMDGRRLIETLRKDPDLASIPVVVATSAPQKSPPGVPVMTKPIRPEDLWDWMRRTCTCAVAPA